MPKKFEIRYGWVPIYPLEIASDSLEDIKRSEYFEKENGAIFGNYLTKKLKESFPEEKIKIVHFDPGAITDDNNQAIYSIIYREGIKKMPILQIKYGEERLALITWENSPNDGLHILTKNALMEHEIKSHSKSIDIKICN
ncbi:MAG: hypothetical protein AABY32_02820 [Nanoarchaeota archaeon]